MIGPHGVPVEVHLQTEEMEQVAEMGITAHWVYKEGGKTIAYDRSSPRTTLVTKPGGYSTKRG